MQRIIFIALVMCGVVPHLSARSGGVNDDVAPEPIIQGRTRALAVDAAGKRYVAGYFSGAQDFNPGVGIAAATSAGDTDAFISCFNADGSHQWTRTFGGVDDDAATAIAVLGSTVYVAGTFASMDAGFDGAGTLDSAGQHDVFVLALNAATGDVVSGFGANGVVTFGGTLEDVATGIAAQGTSLYVCGYFASTDAKLNGAGTYASSGAIDGFVLALNPLTGAPLDGQNGSKLFGAAGMQKLGGEGVEEFQAVAAAGKFIYLSGSGVLVNAGFGGLGTLHGVTINHDTDGFVAMLDAVTGAPAAAFGTGGLKVVGGSGADAFVSIAVQGTTVYAAGATSSNDLGIGALGSNAAAGDLDALVVALDAVSGQPRGSFGNAGVVIFGGAQADAATGVATDATHVYVSGEFFSTLAGFGGPGALSTRGANDAFVLSLDPATGFFAPGSVTFGGTLSDSAVAVKLHGSKVVATGDLFSIDALLPDGSTASGAGFNAYLLEYDPAAIAPVSLFSIDGDGDGFPDDLEAALGASAHSAASTPLNLPANSALVLTPSKLSIKLNFAIPNPHKDSLSVSGVLPVGANFTLPGRRFLVYVGGVVQAFGLDAKGKPAKNSTASFKASLGKAKGTGAPVIAFSAALKSRDLHAQFEDEGLLGTGTVKGVPRTIRVMVLTQGQAYSALIDVAYAATVGKSGTAAGPPKKKK